MQIRQKFLNILEPKSYNCFLVCFVLFLDLVVDGTSLKLNTGIHTTELIATSLMMLDGDAQGTSNDGLSQSTRLNAKLQFC